MSVDNCMRLLKHYEKTGNKEAYEDMLKNLERRGLTPKVSSSKSKK